MEMEFTKQGKGNKQLFKMRNTQSVRFSQNKTNANKTGNSAVRVGSKPNQARKQIDFNALENVIAGNYLDINKKDSLFVDAASLRDVYSHDEIVDYLNSVTQKYYKLPLNVLHLALIKFKSKRYGLLEDAEKLYSIVFKYYKSTEASDAKLLDAIHATMMEVYVIHSKSNSACGLLNDMKKTAEKIYGKDDRSVTVATLLKDDIKHKKNLLKLIFDKFSENPSMNSGSILYQIITGFREFIYMFDREALRELNVFLSDEELNFLINNFNENLTHLAKYMSIRKNSINDFFMNNPIFVNSEIAAMQLKQIYYQTLELESVKNKYMQFIVQNNLAEREIFIAMMDISEMYYKEKCQSVFDWEQQIVSDTNIYFQKACELNPALQNDHRLIRAVLKIKGKYQTFEAQCEFFTKYPAQNNKNGSIYQTMIFAAFRNGDYKLAYKWYEEAIVKGFLKDSYLDASAIENYLNNRAKVKSTLTIDLHCRGNASDGAPFIPSAYDDGVLYAILKNLFDKLASYKCKFIPITIITGRGDYDKHKTRAKLVALLKQNDYTKSEINVEKKGELRLKFNASKYYPDRLASDWKKALEACDSFQKASNTQSIPKPGGKLSSYKNFTAKNSYQYTFFLEQSTKDSSKGMQIFYKNSNLR
ncbi:MAG: hypothetical protein Tsb005_12840 [Gammaproteobacteria bacterium]